jgi:hypothetical protein
MIIRTSNISKFFFKRNLLLTLVTKFVVQTPDVDYLHWHLAQKPYPAATHPQNPQNQIVTWDVGSNKNCEFKYKIPPFGISLSLLPLFTLGTQSSNSTIPTYPMSTCHWSSGWLALQGVAILISLSAPFSLSAHLVPLTNQKMPRSSTSVPIAGE